MEMPVSLSLQPNQLRVCFALQSNWIQFLRTSCSGGRVGCQLSSTHSTAAAVHLHQSGSPTDTSGVPPPFQSGGLGEFNGIERKWHRSFKSLSECLMRRLVVTLSTISWHGSVTWKILTNSYNTVLVAAVSCADVFKHVEIQADVGESEEEQRSVAPT